MLKVSILISEGDVMSIADRWSDLHRRVGRSPFSNYWAFWVWWTNVGCPAGGTLHVVTGWLDDRLVSIYPLVVYNELTFRVLRWAGNDAAFGLPELCERDDDRRAMWEAVSRSPLYDWAEIQYVLSDSPTHRAVISFPYAKVIGETTVSCARFYGMSGDLWFNDTFNGKKQREFRRRERLIEARGGIRYRVYEGPPPMPLVREMLRHKLAWCIKNGLESAMCYRADFLPELIKAAALKRQSVFVCLECGDKPIGFTWCVACGKTLFGYVLAHDPDFADCSPGLLVGLHATRWAADNGFVEFNFMEGPEAFKDRYASHGETMQVYSFCSSFNGRLRQVLLTAGRKYLRPLYKGGKASSS
jgi:CelD/BcsL family acetyltransferase involved in cellulose biosynthesis